MIIKKISFKDKQFAECYDIRKKVFVEEQNIPIDTELDEYDEQAIHYIGYVDGKAVTTARVIKEEGFLKIGRVATLKEHRAKNLASQIIKQIIKDSQGNKIKLNAQMSAFGFYKKLGFKEFGEIFYEEGIEHIGMIYE